MIVRSRRRAPRRNAFRGATSVVVFERRPLGLRHGIAVDTRNTLPCLPTEEIITMIPLNPHAFAKNGNAHCVYIWPQYARLYRALGSIEYRLACTVTRRRFRNKRRPHTHFHARGRNRRDHAIGSVLLDGPAKPVDSRFRYQSIRIPSRQRNAQSMVVQNV